MKAFSELSSLAQKTAVKSVLENSFLFKSLPIFGPSESAKISRGHVITGVRIAMTSDQSKKYTEEGQLA